MCQDYEVTFKPKPDSYWSHLESLSKTAKQLITTRFLRSMSQGALAVDFALYLNALGWSGASIGLLLTLTGLAASCGSIATGPISDRFGRRQVLIWYDVWLIVAGIVAASTSNPTILSLVTISAAFGRGANGAAGPFGPVEQAWLAREMSIPLRSFGYSLNSSVGFFGMGIGAILGTSPYFFQRYLGVAGGYRPLFVLVSLCAFAVTLVLLKTIDQPRALEPDPAVDFEAHQAAKADSALSHDEVKSLWVLVFMNSLNASAIGIVGPLANYWFFKKFGAGPELLGPLQGISFILTAIATHVNAKFASKVGLVESVVYSRAIGLGLLLILPILPTFGLAFAAYMLRGLFNRGTIGNRNAVIANLVRPQHAGKAFSFGTASAQFPMAIGPLISGPLIAADWFATPFYVAGVLQAIYVLSYKRAFGPRMPKMVPIPDLGEALETDEEPD